MDSLITAAAQALARGDPLGALKRVALRDDPPALALRGIAMAQLGDFVRAKVLLKSAARAFGPREAVARARCIVAEAEIAIVSRDLSWPMAALEDACATLDAHGDHLNAAHARNLGARRLLLIGRLHEAEQMLSATDPALLTPPPRAAHELAVAGIAVRRLQTLTAATAFARAAAAAKAAGIPALMAEVENAAAVLTTPAARLLAGGQERLLLLDEVEALFLSGSFVVDACRNLVCQGAATVTLATRPVLFALLRTLSEAWPADVSRRTLLARAFGARQVDESHRARLRVEIGRLREEVRALADITATSDGFRLSLRNDHAVVVLAPPADERHAAILALLADGEAWASSALSIALGASPRTVQRGLEELASENKVLPIGRGRARRWVRPPVPAFPTVLLLPGPLPID
ncbi:MULTISPECIES: DNA-binding protein [unclassified Ensifer]|uniref:DNA-binding protein n=1 Tax=unclassified Ensifer TaxID=2633371 RepID=UPI0008134300|nr:MULTISPECIES: DNA-binding protein [unclassified Ensifer]OCP05663.1 DNA-binding protein [Ensifer sp. LC11]OCP06404.1 DNA-binding protein [Ensifer sp. LC13]OCP06869.1 DNA-binding protein [Ensifer sp. LC14]OCP31356.1 DNA-binding protein [Ensifer sp. LC499]